MQCHCIARNSHCSLSHACNNTEIEIGTSSHAPTYKGRDAATLVKMLKHGPKCVEQFCILRWKPLLYGLIEGGKKAYFPTTLGDVRIIFDWQRRFGTFAIDFHALRYVVSPHQKDK